MRHLRDLSHVRPWIRRTLRAFPQLKRIFMSFWASPVVSRGPADRGLLPHRVNLFRGGNHRGTAGFASLIDISMHVTIAAFAGGEPVNLLVIDRPEPAEFPQSIHAVMYDDATCSELVDIRDGQVINIAVLIFYVASDRTDGNRLRELTCTCSARIQYRTPDREPGHHAGDSCAPRVPSISASKIQHKTSKN